MNARSRFAVKRRYIWREKSPLRTLLEWSLVLFLAYAGLVLGLFFFQRNLLYFPDSTQFSAEEWGLGDFQRLKVETTDGLFISHWVHPPKDAAKPTVIFFQGNAGHVAYRNFKVKPWLEAGFGVVLVGYRGYADNPGKPSEPGLYKDARSILSYLNKNLVPPQSWVFYGESLGSGVAVQMATEFYPAGLILEAPYTSIPAIGAARYPFLPIQAIAQDVYDSIGKITKIRSPLLIIHGDKDIVIPIRFGRMLYDAAPQPKQAAFIPGAGHNDLYDIRTQQLIINFIEALPLNPIVQENRWIQEKPTAP